MPTVNRSILVLLLALAPFAGCGQAARYEVVAPPELRGPVPLEAGRSVELDGIEYEATQVETQFVIRFVNRTKGPIRLTAESALIDARGRPYAVAEQRLGPDESGRLLVPPSLAETAGYEERRPIAGEVRVGGVDEPGLLGDRDDNLRQPALATAERFRWNSGQVARVVLKYDVAGQTVTHDFTIRRK